MSTAELPLRIVPAAAWERDLALRLVLRRFPEAECRQQIEMLLAGEAAGAPAWEGLLAAYRGERQVGAVFSQIQPGKTAAVWSPQLVADEPADTAGQLLDAVTRRLAERNVRVAQALLATDAQPEAETLRKGGFQHPADLLYLVCQAKDFPDDGKSETASAPESQSPQISQLCSELRAEPYCEAAHARFARVVEATYAGTLDCPSLNGVRDVEDVLTGYRATGVFDPSRWLLIRWQPAGEDVGCLILTDHPAHDTWELIYMGVLPQWRGHGWGIDIARWAQRLCRRAGRQRLVLAVDAANAPALRMYAAAGFQAWDRRSVFLKIMGR